ncbi:MAG: hypothetical protein R3Y10_10245 [Ferrimonas sp.]
MSCYRRLIFFFFTLHALFLLPSTVWAVTPATLPPVSATPCQIGEIEHVTRLAQVWFKECSTQQQWSPWQWLPNVEIKPSQAAYLAGSLVELSAQLGTKAAIEADLEWVQYVGPPVQFQLKGHQAYFIAPAVPQLTTIVAEVVYHHPSGQNSSSFIAIPVYPTLSLPLSPALDAEAQGLQLQALGGHNGHIQFQSSQPQILTISDDGHIDIHGYGQVTITAKQQADGGLPALTAATTITVHHGLITDTNNADEQYELAATIQGTHSANTTN